MGMSNKELNHIIKNCPGTTVSRQPVNKPKVKRKRAKPGESPNSVAGMQDGRNIYYSMGEYVFRRKPTDKK